MSLQGTLSTLGITELLELLAQRDASGQLDVTTPNGTASYLFAEGKVSLAEFDFSRGMGEDPAEATYYVLAEEDGHFYYEPQDVEGVPEGTELEGILERSAQVGARWAEVEEAIPSVDHIVCRNSQLDSSVTIEPEWWNVLEVLGSGQSSSQVAAQLEMSSLDASTRLLEMVNAGLLVATDEVAVTEAPVEQEVAIVEVPVEPVEEVLLEDAPVEEVPAAAPVEEAAVEQAPVQEMSFADPDEGELIEESIAPLELSDGPTLGFSDPSEVTDEQVATAPAPPVIESVPVAEIAPEIEPQSEDEAVPTLGFAGAEQATLPEAAPVPEAAPAVPTFGATDEGWSENPFGQSEFEAAEPQTFVEAAPIQQADPIQDLESIDAIDDGASEMFGLDSNFHDAPVPEPAPVPEQSPQPAPVDAPAVADEVMNDLSYLNEDLDQQLAVQPPVAQAPVPEASPPAQASPMPEMETPAPTPQIGEQDPFGSLSDLVVDGDVEEDRSSVLKFLRRD